MKMGGDMHFGKFILLAFLFICTSGCSSTNKLIKCADGKSNIKNKRFALKKKKRSRTPYSYGGGSSASTRTSTPQTASTSTNAPQAAPPIEDVPNVPAEEEPITIAQVPVQEQETQEPVYELISEQPETTPDAVFLEEPTETASVPEPEPETMSPTINNKPPVTPVTVGKVGDPLATPLGVELEPGQLYFRGEIYEKDEKIRFNQFIVFMPNHDIILNPEEANSKLDDLVALLERYPDKKLTIVGNAGYDNFDESDPERYRYQQNPRTLEITKVHYGRGPLVYGQTVFVSDDNNLQRLREEGVRPVSSVVVGQVMRDRARKIKQLLIDRGIAKERLKTSLGEFFMSADRHVTFVVR